jgi:hypothetical protein
VKANEVTNQEPRRSARRRVRRTLGIVAVGMLALSACSSNPGPKRVAQDIIESEAIANSSLDKECLLTELDKFSDDELKAIAENLKPGDVEGDEVTLAEFEALLEKCVAE